MFDPQLFFMITGLSWALLILMGLFKKRSSIIGGILLDFMLWTFFGIIAGFFAWVFGKDPQLTVLVTMTVISGILSALRFISLFSKE
jgi:hypothetical protein